MKSSTFIAPKSPSFIVYLYVNVLDEASHVVISILLPVPNLIVSFGAVFMILVDTAARSLSPSEIPVSVLTAIIGAPVFIALLRKTGGWSL